MQHWTTGILLFDASNSWTSRAHLKCSVLCEHLPRLAQLDPTINVLRDQRIVDDGEVITIAGVASGLDMALHILQRLCGSSAANATAQYIEYPPVKSA